MPLPAVVSVATNSVNAAAIGVPLTVSSGEVLVAGALTRGNPGTFTSFQWDDTDMTSVATMQLNNVGSYLYVLASPTATTSRLTFTTSLSGNGKVLIAATISNTGGSVFGSGVTDGGTGAVSGATATVTDGSTNDTIIDFFAYGNGSTKNVGAGQTSVASVQFSTTLDAYMSIESGAASVDMSWQIDAPVTDGGVTGLALLAATAAAAGAPFYQHYRRKLII